MRGGASDLDVLRAMAEPAFPSLDGASAGPAARACSTPWRRGLEPDPATARHHGRARWRSVLRGVVQPRRGAAAARRRARGRAAGPAPPTSSPRRCRGPRLPRPCRLVGRRDDPQSCSLGDAFSIVDILPDKPRTTPPPVVSSRPPCRSSATAAVGAATAEGRAQIERDAHGDLPLAALAASSARGVGAAFPRTCHGRAPPPAEALVARTPAPPPPVPSTTARLAPPALSRTQPLGQSASRTPPPALARTQPLASTVPVAPPKANVIVARTPPPTAFAPVPPPPPPLPPPLPTAFSQPPQPFPLAYSPAPAHAAMQAPTPAPAPVAWTPAAAGVHDVHAPTFPVLSPARPSRARIAALATVLGVLAVAMLVVVWFRSRAPTAYCAHASRTPGRVLRSDSDDLDRGLAPRASTATSTATATPTPTQAPVTAAVASAAPGPSATAAPPAPPPAVAAVDPIPPTPSAAPAPAGTAGVITVPPSRGGHRVWVDKHIVGRVAGHVHRALRLARRSRSAARGSVRNVERPLRRRLVVTW